MYIPSINVFYELQTDHFEFWWWWDVKMYPVCHVGGWCGTFFLTTVSKSDIRM